MDDYHKVGTDRDSDSTQHDYLNSTDEKALLSPLETVDDSEGKSTHTPSILSYKSIIRQFTITATPLLISNIIINTKSFVTDLLIASIGKKYLSAYGIISQYDRALLVGMYGSMHILQPYYLKREDSLEASQHATSTVLISGLIFSASLSVPMIILLCTSKPILLATDVDPELIDIASDYLKLYSISIPARLVMNTYIQCMLAHCHIKSLIKLSFFRAGIELLLSLSFVKGAGIDFTGIGLAAAIQPYMSSIYAYYLIKKRAFPGFGPAFYHWRDMTQFQLGLKKGWCLFRSYCFKGFSIFLERVAEISSDIYIAVMVGELGNDELAAYQISSSYGSWVLLLLVAMPPAVTITVASQSIESLTRQNYRRISAVSMISGVTVSLLTLPVFIWGYRLLSTAYIDSSPDNNAVRENLSITSSMMGVYLLFYGLSRISGGALLGLKKAIFPSIAGITSAWGVGIGMAKSAQSLGGRLTSIVLAPAVAKACSFAANIFGIFKQSPTIESQRSADVDRIQINPNT